MKTSNNYCKLSFTFNCRQNCFLNQLFETGRPSCFASAQICESIHHQPICIGVNYYVQYANGAVYTEATTSMHEKQRYHSQKNHVVRHLPCFFNWYGYVVICKQYNRLRVLTNCQETPNWHQALGTKKALLCKLTCSTWNQKGCNRAHHKDIGRLTHIFFACM